jgi:transcriptional regulator with XRE-family HTH domain
MARSTSLSRLSGTWNDLRPVFGQRLRDLRRQAQLSQEEVAHRARVHATYLSDLERGLQTPTLDVVNRLATALKVTLAELFGPLDQRFRSRARRTRIDSPRRKAVGR